MQAKLLKFLKNDEPCQILIKSFMNPGKGTLALVTEKKLQEVRRDITHHRKVAAQRMVQLRRLKGQKSNFRGRILPILKLMIPEDQPPREQPVTRDQILLAARIRMRLGKKFQNMPLPSIGAILE